MRQIKLAFRNYSSQPTLLRIAQQMATEKHGLDFEPRFVKGVEEAADSLFSGDVDIIVGQHYTPYNDLRLGKRVVCVATCENVYRNRLVTVPTIKSVADLSGKRFVEADTDWNTCIGLATRVWLDGVGMGDQVKPVLVERDTLVDSILSGLGEACLAGPDHQAKARQAGLVVHDDLPLMKCIQGVTITTRWDMVQDHRDLVIDFLKSLIDAIHFWKTRPDDTLALLEDNERRLGRMTDRNVLESIYNSYRRTLEVKPYPHPEAVMSAYRKCLKLYPEASEVNPGTVWNIQPLREIDESGYIDNLYRGQPVEGLRTSGVRDGKVVAELS